jgi:hypothetical protein
MQAYHWFVLGMLVAWIPGLLVLAAMLRLSHRHETESASSALTNTPGTFLVDRE